MLTLNDGRSELWQWDTGRKLTVDADCTQVHFSNKFFGRSVDVDVFDGTAEIPDVLLQADKDLLVWAFVGTAENGYTKISKVFKVNKRNRPADYVFTPTEQTTLGELIERLDKIEESQDPDAIKNAVDDYLANNPIEIDETDPTVPDWAKQPIKPKYTAKEVGAVATVNGKTPDENGNVEITIPDSGGNVDLTGYAKEQWVQQNYQPKGEYLTAVPDGYAKTEDIPTKPEDIGAQPSGNYALKTEIPSVPVQSVNGKTGAVKLSASDVGARPDNWMPSAQEVGALPNTYTPPNQTAAQVGADPKGTAASAVSQHNVDDDSHNDIRLELKAINDKLTAFFDSDNQTLDELSEIVSYITSNKALIDSITTSKVSVVDIINNLTTNVANKPLSAAQGVVLKGLIDAVSNSLSNYQPKGDYALRSELPTVPTKVSQLQNDKGYLTEHQDISGKLDANKLPEAVNTALAQAKESGEFDGEKGDPGVTPHIGANGNWYIGSADTGVKAQGKDGTNGTSVTVESVSESTADGGSNVVTFSDGKTLNVKNGSKGNKGDPGTTPRKGIDFWTPADQEAIVQQVITALGTPVFGRVDAENNIILTGKLADGIYTIKYEDAEGEQTVIGTLNHTVVPEPTYTNQIPISTDTDGTVFNGKGYKENTRFNSSGVATNDANANGWYATGFIPMVEGDTIRSSDGMFDKNDTTGYQRVVFYKADKSVIADMRLNTTNLGSSTFAKYFSVSDSGALLFNLNINGIWGATFNGTAAYCRICAKYIDDNSIVTINEEIV